MHCSKATRLMQLYIDRQLRFEQMRELEMHISTCPACQEELFLFEKIGRSLAKLEQVVEPADLTTNIMRRVAMTAQTTKKSLAESAFSIPKVRQENAPVAIRPSLRELFMATVLATFAMLGIILTQPSLRSVLPIANGHDALSLFFINAWDSMIRIDSSTLMLGFWIIGTVLGVWIALTFAGAEMRGVWYRAVASRLPSW